MYAGQYSVTARITVVVTAACSAVAAVLFLVYNMVMLRGVKRRHERETEALEREDGDLYEEGRSTGNARRVV